MASLLSSYEQQFSVLTAEIVQRIGKIPNHHGTEKKTLISSIERQLDEAQELLEQMDLEIRELPNSERGKLMGKMKSYQTEFNNLESQIKKAKSSSLNVNKMRDELIGIDDTSYGDQRTRLLDNTERLENSTRRLEVGYRVATETEQIGQDILDNLQRDREKINRSRQRLKEGDGNLAKSSRIVSSMTRRIIQNRLLLMIIIGVMVVIIIIAIYFSVKKEKS